MLALLAAVALAPITSGDITVGQGVNGVTLVMKRAPVVAKLGEPLRETRYGAMSYSEEHIFDVIRTAKAPSGTVRLFVVSDLRFPDWTLQDGNQIFRKGGVKRLIRRYGDRLEKRTDESLAKNYILPGRFKGRSVETAFLVDRYKPSRAHVLDVFITYTD